MQPFQRLLLTSNQVKLHFWKLETISETTSPRQLGSCRLIFSSCKREVARGAANALRESGTVAARLVTSSCKVNLGEVADPCSIQYSLRYLHNSDMACEANQT